MADEERLWCAAILPRVSRTFALSIQALPGELRRPVRAAYLLCRVADNIEDCTGISSEQRMTLFQLFDRTLAGDDESPLALEGRLNDLARGLLPAEAELGRRAGAVFRAFRALPGRQREVIRPAVLEMSRGMAAYALRADLAGRLVLQDMGDLETYCHYVAGTVGQLLTGLFLQHVPGPDPATGERLRRLGESFGAGLQLVNILKDVGEDAARGVCYIPRQLALEHGLDPDRLLERGQDKAMAAVMRGLAARARSHLARAAEYTRLWSGPGSREVRLFCLVPLALALGTLDLMEQAGGAPSPGPGPKLSRLEVGRILTEASQAVDDEARLAALLAGQAGAPATTGAEVR